MANDGVRANMNMPQNVGAMGLHREARGQIWPTVPMQSTDPSVASFVRYYSATLAFADTDNVVNTTATRIVRFDLPTIVCAVNATALISTGAGWPIGVSPRDSFSLALATANGERITVESRLASTFVGTGEHPGFLAGGGWVFGAGSAATLLITPIMAGLGAANTRIDVVLMCLEFRTGSSYVGGR
ncbi:MAG: hypothetical protein Q8P18_33185 [Pseudomonadota bacterium]|nr:hypothetical protein [Pseudomonadota bacterium]